MAQLPFQRRPDKNSTSAPLQPCKTRPCVSSKICTRFSAHAALSETSWAFNVELEETACIQIRADSNCGCAYRCRPDCYSYAHPLWGSYGCLGFGYPDLCKPNRRPIYQGLPTQISQTRQGSSQICKYFAVILAGNTQTHRSLTPQLNATV